MVSPEQMRPDVSDRPDWRRWPNEPTRGYLLRIVSQVVWELGSVVGRFADRSNKYLWDLSDQILDYAYPQAGPVDVTVDQPVPYTPAENCLTCGQARQSIDENGVCDRCRLTVVGNAPNPLIKVMDVRTRADDEA